MPDSPKGEMLIYQTDDGRVKPDVRLENETIWLTQPLMVELFQTTQQNISQHIRNISWKANSPRKRLTRNSCRFTGREAGM